MSSKKGYGAHKARRPHRRNLICIYNISWICHVWNSTYVWKCISICEYLCLCVINTYVRIYVYMYTYLVYVCHKQVDMYLCKCNHMFHNTHMQTHVQWQTCFIQTHDFWAYEWCKKMPKIHTKSLCDALALLKFFLYLRWPCGAPRFTSVVVDLHLRLWNRSEGQHLISFRLVYRDLPLDLISGLSH